MVQAFDHRAASVVVNPTKQHRPAQAVSATVAQPANPSWVPTPRFWVNATQCAWCPRTGCVLGFEEITAATNVRTMISALLPAVGFGNKVPLLKLEAAPRLGWAFAANLNSTVFDFVARQKIQGQTLNLFIIEQFPVVAPGTYEQTRFGPRTAAEVVRETILELTYTAHDMAPFARDLGYVDGDGRSSPRSLGTKTAACFSAQNSTPCSSISTASPTGTTSDTSTPRSPS